MVLAGTLQVGTCLLAPLFAGSGHPECVAASTTHELDVVAVWLSWLAGGHP